MAEKMTDNEQFEAYQKLSEQLFSQYNFRRELEWKIHVAIWTLLAAIGYLLVSEKIHLGPVIIALFFTLPLHFLWCVKIHKGEFRDRDLSVSYRKAAERILVIQPKGEDQPPHLLIDNDPQPPPPFQKRFESYWWWILAEVGTTALIASAIAYVAW